jgi:hypothetical protein
VAPLTAYGRTRSARHPGHCHSPGLRSHPRVSGASVELIEKGFGGRHRKCDLERGMIDTLDAIKIVTEAPSPKNTSSR